MYHEKSGRDDLQAVRQAGACAIQLAVEMPDGRTIHLQSHLGATFRKVFAVFQANLRSSVRHLQQERPPRVRRAPSTPHASLTYAEALHCSQS